MRQLLVMIILLAMAASLHALPVVSFEAGSAPGWNPSTANGGTVITNQFEASHGVTFSSSASPGVQLVVRGHSSGPLTFCGPNCDNTSSFASLSQFMVWPSFSSGTMTLDFTHAVNQSTGDLIDIEGSESVLITALNSSNNVVASQVLNGGSPGAGEGSVIQWNLTSASSNITRVTIQGNPSAGGWALDNISGSQAAVPEPSSLLLVLVGGLLVVCQHKKVTD